VTAILFVTAIQEYDQFLYEDEKVNRLHESLNIFDQLLNNQFLKHCTWILFLNKKDLFAEKIKTVNLTVCFDDYIGENTLENAQEFISKRFQELNKDARRKIFPHLTCATDTDNISKVFKVASATILQNHLAKMKMA